MIMNCHDVTLRDPFMLLSIDNSKPTSIKLESENYDKETMEVCSSQFFPVGSFKKN